MLISVNPGAIQVRREGPEPESLSEASEDDRPYTLVVFDSPATGVGIGPFTSEMWKEFISALADPQGAAIKSQILAGVKGVSDLPPDLKL